MFAVRCITNKGIIVFKVRRIADRETNRVFVC